MPEIGAPPEGMGPSYYDPIAKTWKPLPTNAEGVHYNPLQGQGLYPGETNYNPSLNAAVDTSMTMTWKDLQSQINLRNAQGSAALTGAQAALAQAGVQRGQYAELARQFPC